MKTTTVIISVIIALIIGSGIGYSLGNMGASNDAQAKKLQDSVTMMKEQSASIRKMGEMMKTAGTAMQELGMKYKDDAVVSQGKDLAAVGEKYITEDAKATGSSDVMKKTME